MTSFYWDASRSSSRGRGKMRKNAAVPAWSAIPRAPYALYPEVNDLVRCEFRICLYEVQVLL